MTTNFDFAKLLRKSTFPEADAKAVCAVSGGADSIAMALLANEAGCRVEIIHIDHGLRKESSHDAEFVMRFAKKFGFKSEIRSVDLTPGPNLEARARIMRHNALPLDALYAHTADDQAETVLLNLMRGASTRGLSGISPRNHPILKLRRSDTLAVCEYFGIEPVVDLTNNDSRFRRNRVRNELIPLLNEIAQRDVVDVMSKMADIMRDDDTYLDDLADMIDPTNCRQLREVPLSLARRAIRIWLEPHLIDETGESHPPSSAAVDRVLSVVRNEAAATDVSAGVSVRRSQGKLFLERTDSYVANV
jgi:tRNA(Ile)-lysidine synthase